MLFLLLLFLISCSNWASEEPRAKRQKIFHTVQAIKQEDHMTIKEISEDTVNMRDEYGNIRLIALVNHIGIKPIQETLAHADILIKTGSFDNSSGTNSTQSVNYTDNAYPKPYAIRRHKLFNKAVHIKPKKFQPFYNGTRR